MKSFWSIRPFSSTGSASRIRLANPYGSEKKVEEGYSTNYDERSHFSSDVDLIRANVIKKSQAGGRFKQRFPKWYGHKYVQGSTSGGAFSWPRSVCAFMITAILTISVLVALLIYFNIHLRRQIPSNDLQRATHMQGLVASWSSPIARKQADSQYPKDLSRYITPIPCHSHNDYKHKIPLYEALAAGCTGVEADVWLKDNDLLVGHTKDSLTSTRSLKTLYIDPLVSILTHQNPSANGAQTNGVFESSPQASLTLLIDLKTNGPDTFPIVHQHLEPLRSRGWLTHFNGTTVVLGPITVVGTGNTPFDLLNSNSTYRDIFFDAPLDKLATGNGMYTTNNSYYASVSFDQAIGKVSHGVLSSQQVDTIRAQVEEARKRGLKARYWDTPSSPVAVRDYVWDTLEEEGVGMLNVDDVEAASRRAW